MRLLEEPTPGADRRPSRLSAAWNSSPGKADGRRSRLCLPGDRIRRAGRDEFWTSRQRAAHSLHEVSYRACFKPQVPRFFIERLTWAGETIYDPFAGRGGFLLEAALLGRTPTGCDINPISRALLWPSRAPSMTAILARLAALDLQWSDLPADLRPSITPRRWRESCARSYLLDSAPGVRAELDDVDEWIRMVTLNRLTGHSPGFLSVYTTATQPGGDGGLQAAHQRAAPANAAPPCDLRRSCHARSAQLLTDVDDVARAARASGVAHVCASAAAATRTASESSVHLVDTSPTVLDVVDYATDNWLRAWFLGIDAGTVPVTMVRRVTGGEPS